jgi:DNA-binding CsgD family transcriptional regulator
MNDFKFSFSTPYYEHINHIQYRYRLEGFKESWSDWGSQTQKEYTNLPHGSYRFQVEAKNAYAKTSTSDSFAFVIEPPWIATVWARALLSLIVFILLFGFYRYMRIRMKKEQQKLRQKQAIALKQKEDEFKEEAKKSEAEIIRLRNEKLMIDIDHKNRELASTTMHLVQKGEMLNRIKQELNKLLPSVFPDNREKVKRLIRTIVEDARLDDNWEKFEYHYDQVHEDFLKRMRDKYPSLTPKDQKLCAYLRMNLSTKEIAPLMNISVRGVEISRYRLRKKLELDTDKNLVEFLIKL